TDDGDVDRMMCGLLKKLTRAGGRTHNFQLFIPPQCLRQQLAVHARVVGNKHVDLAPAASFFVLHDASDKTGCPCPLDPEHLQNMGGDCAWGKDQSKYTLFWPLGGASR